MSGTLQNFYRDAYSQFEAELIAKWAVDGKQLAAVIGDLKGVYKRQLSLACAATITGLRGARNEYAKEMVETSYLSVVLAVKGLTNCSCVLARQTIELALKHIYFATHPVEYGWVASRLSYKEINFSSLMEYVKKTDEYREYSKGGGRDVCGDIEEKFADLSRYVHVQSKGFMSYKRMITIRKIDGASLRRLDSITASLWPALSVMLVIFFPSRFLRSQEIEKKLIRNGLSRELKTSLARYMRTWALRRAGD